MNIIGIDPSLRNTGLALLSENEVRLFQISTSKEDHDFLAGKQVSDWLSNMLEQLWSPGTEIVFEMPAGSQSQRASRAGGVIIGVLSSVLGLYHNTYLGASAIKKFVGSPEVKGSQRKALNVAKAYELYPNANWDVDSKGYPKRKEEHKADALLLAHIWRTKYV